MSLHADACYLHSLPTHVRQQISLQKRPKRPPSGGFRGQTGAKIRYSGSAKATYISPFGVLNLPPPQANTMNWRPSTS